ncbi:MAG: hypothetical protein WCF12_13690 [Propionicimonas sp.]
MNTQIAEALAEYRARLHPDEPPRPKAKRWRWGLVTGLTVLLMLGGLWAWLRPDTGSTPTTAPQLADEHVVDLTGRLPAADPTPDPAGVGATAAPLVVAPQTTWRPWETIALRTWLPASSAGPGQPDRLMGFTHTPEGAVVAAANVYPAIYYTRDRSAWRDLAERRVLWADGSREALWEALEPVWTLAGGGLTLRPVGFRMLSYTPELSRVRLWWRTESPAAAPVIVGAIATVHWVDGDWWLVFDEPASDLRTIDPARDGYVPWGPGVAQ